MRLNKSGDAITLEFYEMHCLNRVWKLKARCSSDLVVSEESKLSAQPRQVLRKREELPSLAQMDLDHFGDPVV